MKFKIVFLLCIISVMSLRAQKVKELNSDQLVSEETFTKLLFQDLNFLILGDNAPAQGIATELTDNGTDLSINGYLGANKKTILTLDGSFAVDEGVYFFDENGGSKRATFSVNVFVPLGYARYFPKNSNPNVRRALLLRKFMIEDTIQKSYMKYYELYNLMKAAKLPVDALDKHDLIAAHADNEIIIENKPNYDDMSSMLRGLIQKYELDKSQRVQTISGTYSLKFEDDNKNEIEESYTPSTITINAQTINVYKLITLYETTLKQLQGLMETISNWEISNAANKWTAKRMAYLGFSPYYQRENVTVFKYIEGGNFNDFFSDQRGDLYGLNASINWFYQNKKYLFYARVLTSVGRGSNIGSFAKKTYIYDEVIGNGTNVANEKVGYTNRRGETYGYGTATSGKVELYGTINNFGVFTKISFEAVNFKDNTRFKRVERYPFRAGVLFNLKSTDETKNLLTLQLFADRSNLKLDPTPTDPTVAGDWRFGFKIGLPINIKQGL